jgi:translation initiation factor IF-1
MSKEDLLQADGVVAEVLPNTTFRVKLTLNNLVILAHLSGRMKKNNIKVLLGDQVQVEMSVYDLSKGRIVYRK